MAMSQSELKALKKWGKCCLQIGWRCEMTQTNLMLLLVLCHRIKKSINIWSEQETKMLLFLYGENLSLVGPQLPFATKKALWKFADQINSEFQQSFTPTQIEG